MDTCRWKCTPLSHLLSEIVQFIIYTPLLKHPLEPGRMSSLQTEVSSFQRVKCTVKTLQMCFLIGEVHVQCTYVFFMSSSTGTVSLRMKYISSVQYDVICIYQLFHFLLEYPPKNTVHPAIPQHPSPNYI